MFSVINVGFKRILIATFDTLSIILAIGSLAIGVIPCWFGLNSKQKSV